MLLHKLDFLGCLNPPEPKIIPANWLSHMWLNTGCRHYADLLVHHGDLKVEIISKCHFAEKQSEDPISICGLLCGPMWFFSSCQFFFFKTVSQNPTSPPLESYFALEPLLRGMCLKITWKKSQTHHSALVRIFCSMIHVNYVNCHNSTTTCF